MTSSVIMTTLSCDHIGPEVLTIAITEPANMEAVRPKSKSKSKKKASRVSQEGMLGSR